MSPRSAVPDWPVIELRLGADGAATMNGRRLAVPTGSDPRSTLLHEAVRAAITLGRPVRVLARDPSGTWKMVAEPGGDIRLLSSSDPSAPRWPSRAAAPATTGRSAAATIDEETVDFTTVGETRAGETPAGETPGERTPLVESSVGETSLGETPVGEAPPVPSGSEEPEPEPEPAGTDHGGAGLVREPEPARSIRAAARPSRPKNASRPKTRSTSGPSDRSVARRASPLALVLPGILIVGVMVVAASTMPHGGDNPTDLSARVSGSGPEPARLGDITTPSTSGASGPAAGSSPAPGASALAAAPPGFRNRPSWALPLASWTKAAVGAAGSGQERTVLSRDPAGRVERIDAGTGAVTWSTRDGYDLGWVGPMLTRIDGRPAAALVSKPAPGAAGTLLYWPLPDRSVARQPVTDAPTRVTLPAGAVLNWIGSTPLVLLPKGGAGLVRGGAVTVVPIPAGYRALVADGDAVLAAKGASWVRVAPGAAAVVHPIVTPPGATGVPVRVEPVGDRFLLAAWPKPVGKVQAVALIEAASGRTVVQGGLPATVDVTHALVVRQNTGPLTAIGQVIVDPDRRRLDVLQSPYTVVSVTPGHVYATSAGHPTDVTLSSGTTFTGVAFPAGADLVPFAVVGDGAARTALLLSPSDVGWMLTGLPAG